MTESTDLLVTSSYSNFLPGSDMIVQGSWLLQTKFNFTELQAEKVVMYCLADVQCCSGQDSPFKGC